MKGPIVQRDPIPNFTTGAVGRTIDIPCGEVGTSDLFYPGIEPVVSMFPADPRTAISEDYNHQCTLPSRRTKFNVFGADEYLRGTAILGCYFRSKREIEIETFSNAKSRIS